MARQSAEDWLGSARQIEDDLSPALANRVAATLGAPRLAPGDALPPLWHWAFFQPAVDGHELGRDGHPARGGFLPAADDRNRMWAGGRVHFDRPLCVGRPARCESEIIAIDEKQGRSGALLFVTVRHRYRQDDTIAFSEEQDIVYREPSPPRRSLDQALPQPDWQETVTPTPTLLFRYSAVTFNGHRIHYDWPYVTDTEGYPGLVVHGPLIATLLVGAFSRARPRARPARLSYRGLRPLVAPEPFAVCGRIEAPGRASLWAANDNGPAQQAELIFTEN